MQYFDFTNFFYVFLSGDQIDGDTSKTYICDFDGCGKALKTLTSLKLHTSTHSNKVIFILFFQKKFREILKLLPNNFNLKISN